MTSLIGHLTVLSALFVSVGGALASFYGGFARKPDFVALGRIAALAVFALLTLACGVMIYALVTHDFSVSYVAEVGSRETPLYYTITSLWGALEGSILFWGVILAGYTALVAWLYRQSYAEIMPYVAGILLSIAAFFLGVLSGPGNPFGYIANPPTDGGGPNVLLQNNLLMGVHPPMLYLGYVGLSVPYAIAMAALLRGNVHQSWLGLARRWSLIAWGFLTIGIILGMWWSYEVLGWGGYWSWDPVENAVLMPWLVTTAFLHSLQVQERRGMLKTWTITLIVAAFLLSIMGTFLTRSGILESVHSFTQSALGPVFLGFLGAVLLISLVLLLSRSEELAVPGTLDAILSRESAFLLNNLLLAVLTFTVLLGTLFPLLAEAVSGQRLSVGAPYFNRVAVPVAVALLFLMGVGPVLPWRRADAGYLSQRLLLPMVAAVAALALLIAVGMRGVGALLTFSLAVFVATVTLGNVWRDVGVRRGNTGEGMLSALGRLVRANPRRYGGYLVHLGVLVVAVGIAASQSFSVGSEHTLHLGQSMRVDGYTLTLAAIQPDPQPNRMVLRAIVNVGHDGHMLGSMAPSVNFYPTAVQPVITPAVHTSLYQDLYLAMRAVDQHASTVTLQVYVKPLVSWIWTGGGIIGLGALAALLPKQRRRPLQNEATQEPPAQERSVEMVP
jgi:cytochrome c-type biogenesis protein CcmF